MKKALLTFFKIALFLCYPFLVFFALSKGVSPRYLSLLLLLALLLQFKTQNVKIVRNILIFICLALFTGLFVFNDALFLQLYPIMISLSLLFTFGLSLKSPPCMIERFARIKTKKLPSYAVSYCHKVTILWCVFFFFNALVSFYTTFLPLKWWTLYNGFISYILIGALFGIEFIFRQIYMKKMEGKKK